jgi:hypothetical protein
MSVANYGGLPIDDLPGTALGPAPRPAMVPMPQPELRHFISTFIVATLSAGRLQFTGRLAYDLQRQAEDAARERGERLGLPVRKLGAVDPQKVTGADCVIMFERKVCNGAYEVFDPE